ncbi:LOB domain-containing protein 25 [Acorus calamus]|uniref:LOB domain-containing protein 25 n=1 Tax=Acorus calamus TaxID=4465 RepID=A0AAV9FHT8_ACOCL|nr:LOB domain-containing protein 25 [Acorus calamus]
MSQTQEKDQVEEAAQTHMEKFLVGCGQFHFSAIVHHEAPNVIDGVIIVFDNPIIIELPLRGLQVPPAQVHAGLHLRPILPTGRAPKVRKRSQDLRSQQRIQAPQRGPPPPEGDTVSSLAYEAEARVKDPVYGCVGAISVLQRQVLRLQKELDKANSDLIRYASNATSLLPALPPAMVASSQLQIMDTQFDRLTRGGGGGGDRGGLRYYPSSGGDVDDVED